MNTRPHARPAALLALSISLASCVSAEFQRNADQSEAALAALPVCEGCPKIATRVDYVEGLEPLLQQGRASPVRVHLKRKSHPNVKATPAAHDAAETALQDFTRPILASAATTQATGSALDVEIESFFYVYTTKFNAQEAWVSDFYMQSAQQDASAPTQAPDGKVDVLRVIAGVVGAATGLVSPTFGAYMISSGTTPVMGGGKAPNRSLLPTYPRFQRGEQEFVSKVRVSSGDRKASFQVISNARGDSPPFLNEEMRNENWRRVLDTIRPQTAEAVPD
jgi:hypothetical protein